MATKRNKKQARQVRLRTAVRKVVMRIRRIEERVDESIPKDTFEYWYTVCKQLKLSELQLAADYVTKTNATDRWTYRVDLFNVMSDALKTALVEKTIGLTHEEE